MVTEEGSGDATPVDSTDVEKVRSLFPLWYATRLWAEELLCKSFGLKSASEILRNEYRGRRRIPGTAWFYRPHGVGVDIDRGLACGGIDFDFNSANPDAWRLHLFAVKQLNDGNLLSDEYWEIVDDEDRFRRAATAALDACP